LAARSRSCGCAAERPALRHSITVHNAAEPRGSYPQHGNCAPQEWLRSEAGCSNSFHQSDHRTERLQACMEPNPARRWLERCWPISRERMMRPLSSSSLSFPSIVGCGQPFPGLSPPGRGGECSLTYSRSTVTGASPENPSACAAAGVTSMMRPRTKGPRSLTVTTTEWPLLRLVTRTFDPKGSDRWAAVNAPGFNLNPLAVRDPLSVE
jgi:hypothetical protein